MTDIKLLTAGLVIPAIAVGTLIIGKKYYQKYITEKTINSNYSDFQKHLINLNSKYNTNNYFTIDRLIDADCNGKPLSIGVNSIINPNNILSHQGIRHGNTSEPIKKLVSFIKVDNGLIYEFEDNTKLTITTNDKTDVLMYSFKSGNLYVTKEMTPELIKVYKPIGMISNELDKIGEIINKSSQPKKELQ